MWVLESRGLPARWAELDRFEGDDYRRVLVPVRLRERPMVVADLYALRGADRQDGRDRRASAAD